MDIYEPVKPKAWNMDGLMRQWSGSKDIIIMIF